MSYRFLYLLFVVSVVALGLPGSARSEGGWEVITYKGRSYVPLSQVAEFYRFSNVARSGRSFTLARPGVEISGREGDKAVTVNGLRLFLSFPVLPWGEKSLVSSFDVAHTIDAILRPPRPGAGRKLETVVIDAAHGGDEPGARNRDLGPEKVHTLAVAHLLAERLEERGFVTVLTREDDGTATASERAAKANAVPGEAVFVSLHLNTSRRLSSKGIETYILAPTGTPATYDPEGTRPDLNYYLGNIHEAENAALATALHGSLVVASRAPDLGLKRARFGEIRGVRMPGAVVRLGFLSHPEEGPKLAGHEYRNLLASAIADGIGRYAAYLGGDSERREAVAPGGSRTLTLASVENVDEEGDGDPGVVSLSVRIQATGGTDVDPAEVDVEVYFLDLVNGEYIEPVSGDPPEVHWASGLPSWRESDVEEVVVSVRRDQNTAAGAAREYFGHVVRVLYNGSLQSVSSSPPNLERCLPQFYPVRSAD